METCEILHAMTETGIVVSTHAKPYDGFTNRLEEARDLYEYLLVSAMINCLPIRPVCELIVSFLAPLQRDRRAALDAVRSC